AVVRLGTGLGIRGRILEEGDELSLFLGPIHVQLEHTVRARLPPEWAGLWDQRFLAAALLIVAAGTWIDAAEAWLDRQPPDAVAAVTQVRELVRSVGSDSLGGSSRAVAMPAAKGPDPVPEEPTAFADGPRHEDDDHLTRMGWAAWYRQLVPNDDDQLFEAQQRFALDPGDPWARRVLARSAYDHDNADEASRHYGWLAERFPQDSAIRLRLARADQRRGHHRSEVVHYETILERDPSHAEARAGMAVGLARMNRLDEAAVALDQLEYIAPDAPMTALTVAQLAALTGHHKRALEALDRAFRNRSALSDEGQLELRRTIALDPAFASLRRDPRLRSLIYRHLGAAGVRPMR
ncbi:MAG: tetratricopeptide repeat protein, partial [Myxococcota bacterium]|nr:tetratricopeptide repeat protein [Myxococcota bacterium]